MMWIDPRTSSFSGLFSYKIIIIIYKIGTMHVKKLFPQVHKQLQNTKCNPHITVLGTKINCKKLIGDVHDPNDCEILTI